MLFHMLTAHLCHTYEWVMSHLWMSRVTHMNDSCHTHVGERGETAYVVPNSQSTVMSHMRMSHVTSVKESCHICEWVMSHTHRRKREDCICCSTCSKHSPSQRPSFLPPFLKWPLSLFPRCHALVAACAAVCISVCVLQCVLPCVLQCSVFSDRAFSRRWNDHSHWIPDFMHLWCRVRCTVYCSVRVALCVLSCMLNCILQATDLSPAVAKMTAVTVSQVSDVCGAEYFAMCVAVCVAVCVTLTAPRASLHMWHDSFMCYTTHSYEWCVHMYVYIYIRIHTYMYRYIYTCIYTNMPAYIDIYTYTCICM